MSDADSIREARAKIADARAHGWDDDRHLSMPLWKWDALVGEAAAKDEQYDRMLREARQAIDAECAKADAAEREAAALREALQPFADAHAYKIAKGRRTKPPAIGPKELRAAYEALAGVVPAQKEGPLCPDCGFKHPDTAHAPAQPAEERRCQNCGRTKEESRRGKCPTCAPPGTFDTAPGSTYLINGREVGGASSGGEK